MPVRKSISPRILAILPLCLIATAAFGQAKKGAAPAQPKTFTIDFSEGSLDGLPVGLAATLRESRQGAAVRQTDIEVCYSASATARNADRFTATLTLRDGAWRGSAVTLLGKAPVEIALQRTGKPGALNFAGEIRQQDKIIRFEQQETNFTEESAPPDNNEQLEVLPATAPEVSPNSISIIVRPASIAAFLPLLRKHRVATKSDNLFASCESLRVNAHSISVEVDPARAAALVEEARAIPGFVRAGWTSGTTLIADAVRIPAGAFLVNGAVDRDKLIAAVVPVIAGAIGQKPGKAPEFNASTGVVALNFSGPSTNAPGAGLADTTAIHILATPEGLQSKTHLVLYLEDIDRSMADSASGIKIVETKGGEGGESDTGLRRALQAALVRALGGEVWDDQKNVWVK